MRDTAEVWQRSARHGEGEKYQFSMTPHDLGIAIYCTLAGKEIYETRPRLRKEARDTAFAKFSEKSISKLTRDAAKVWKRSTRQDEGKSQ